MSRLPLALVLFLSIASSTLAQRTITGTITDEDGDPLIGASKYFQPVQGFLEYRDGYGVQSGREV